MENYLFSLKSITAGWLSFSPTSWTIKVIFIFLCILGVYTVYCIYFFLLFSYFRNDPSLPPHKKYRSSRKHRVEPQRRSRRSQKKAQTLKTLKACRDCLQELEEVQDLISLLQSYLGRLPDQGAFHHLLHQEAPEEVSKAAPARTHKPRKESGENAAHTLAPSASPAPLHRLLPLDSTLPAEPQEDQNNLKKILLGTITKSLLPGNSSLASLILAVSGLRHADYPILSFSWWWESTKSLFFPTSSQHKCQQEHLACHPPEASFWGGPTNWQIETYKPSFVTSDVQKLLEILITKRVELKIWKEKEKDGSIGKQLCPDNHLNSLGTMWKLLSAEQTTITPQSFWNMKDEPEQLASPQQLSSPKILEDHLQQKCSQLFWGLPSLHSESLLATALVCTHSPQLQVPFLLFNGLSNCLPALIQDQISSQFSHVSSLPHHGIQPQPSTPIWPQPQAHLAPSVPIRPPSLPPQMSACGVPCPASQEKTQFFIPTETQQLEWPLLPKHQERGRTLHYMMKRYRKFFGKVPPKLPKYNQDSQSYGSVSIIHGDFIIFNIQKHHHQRRLSKDKHRDSLPHRVQVSLELMWPPNEFPETSKAQDNQGFSRPFVFKGKSSQTTQRTKSRDPRSFYRKSQTRSQLQNNLGKGLQQCLKRSPTDLSRVSASFPVKVLGTDSEEELERHLMRTLKSDQGKHLARGPGKKHLEKNLEVHLCRKLGQINEGLIPVSVRRSWFMATHSLPKSHLGSERRNLAPLNDRKPCINTSHELPFLSPHTRQMLEAHIIRFRVRHKWDLPSQAFEPIDLKLCEAQPLPLPLHPSPCSATCVSGTHSRAMFYKFLGKPPQPHLGEEITEESIPTSESPQPVPSSASEEIQQASPGDVQEPSEVPLPGQEDRSPSQTSTLSLTNRTLESEIVMGAKKDNLESGLSSATARNELKDKSGDQASQNKVAILKMKLRSQFTRAEEAKEETEPKKAPAWKVILKPSMLANNQTIYVDLRRSGSPCPSKSPLPPTELAAQDLKDPCLKAKVASKFELQEKVESENQPQGPIAGVPLQDSSSDISLQDSGTCDLVQDHDIKVPLQDSPTDVLLTIDPLSTHKSSSCSQREHASGDTPASPVPHDLVSSELSSEVQQEPSIPKAEDPCKSQSEMTISTAETEDLQSPKSEEHEECAEPLGSSVFQAGGTGHPPRVRGTGDSLGSKYLQLMPERGQVIPESHFRKKVRNFLQCLNLNKKGKGLEDPLQKGKPVSATAQREVPVRSRSVMDSRATEAQTIVTAVGRVLVEKLGLYQGMRASDVNMHKEFQAPGRGHSRHHKVLSSPEQRRVMRETASKQQAIPKGHSCPNRAEWIPGRDSRWEGPPRELGAPGRPSQHRLMLAGASGHIHRYPTYSLQKCVSSHQAVCAPHTCHGRKALLQEKVEYMQRKPFVSHVSTSSMC
ncbi:spermatogenesis-associated protein 31E1-like [Lycaon pictus]